MLYASYAVFSIIIGEPLPYPFFTSLQAFTRHIHTLRTFTQHCLKILVDSHTLYIFIYCPWPYPRSIWY